MKISDMNIIRKTGIILFALLMVVLNCEACHSQGSTNVDWLQGYVSVKARGYAKITGSPADIDNAIDAAKVVAQSDLLEAIRGVHINRQTAVGDLMEERTETSIRVRGVLRNSLLIGEPKVTESNGFVSATVEMRVCLYNNGLGCRSEQPLISILPKLSGKNNVVNDSCSLLPNIKSTQEVLSKVTYDTHVPLKLVVINLKGKPVNTVNKDFVIGYQADNGQNCSVYSPDKIDSNVRRDRGTAELFIYVKDANAKYGANVLIIPAISINSQNYIVIDANDAYLINLVNEQANNVIFKNALIGIAVQ